MMKFSNEWTCVDAICAMFCSDTEILERFGVDETRLKQICCQAFDHEGPSNSQNGLLRRVETVVQEIKDSMGEITPLSTRHAMIWARWAFQVSEVPVSSKFILRLARRKAKLATSGFFIMQHMDSLTERWTGRSLKADGIVSIRGYFIDEIILGAPVACDVYAAKWRLRKADILSGEGSVIVDKKNPTEQSIALPKRDVSAVCGTKAVTILGEVIADAAKSRRFSVLSLRKVDGRYQCTTSRTDLVKLLKTRYSKLAGFEVSTLNRALSSFVACPRGRPGGIPPTVRPTKSAKKKTTPPRR